MPAERLELDVALDPDARPGNLVEALARLLIGLGKKEASGRQIRRPNRFDVRDASASMEHANYGRGRG
jgi:hypothetical protein